MFPPEKTAPKSVMAVCVMALLLSAAFSFLFSAPIQGTGINGTDSLQISTNWAGGDILTLEITDTFSAEHQTVALRLSDLLGEDENVPYIMLQAMDLLGERKSAIIQIENPLYRPYVPQPEPEPEPSILVQVQPRTQEPPGPLDPPAPTQPSLEEIMQIIQMFQELGMTTGEPQIPPPIISPDPTPPAEITLSELGYILEHERDVTALWMYHDLRLEELMLTHGASLAALFAEHDMDINYAMRQYQSANLPSRPPMITPDGAGTVVDNLMTINDIEFFTINANEGADFFLVIDRQRPDNNVYLLNAVTEADLHALAVARAEETGQPIPPRMPLEASLQAPQGVQEPTEPQPALEEIMQMMQMFQEIGNTANEPQTPPPEPQGGISSGIILLLGLAALIGGGTFLIFKVLLPKMRAAGQANEAYEEDESEDDEEGGYGGKPDYSSVEDDDDDVDNSDYSGGSDDSEYPGGFDNSDDSDYPSNFDNADDSDDSGSSDDTADVTDDSDERGDEDYNEMRDGEDEDEN